MSAPTLHVVPGLSLAFGVALVGPQHFERLTFVRPGEPERLAEFDTPAAAQAAIRAAEAKFFNPYAKAR